MFEKSTFFRVGSWVAALLSTGAVGCGEDEQLDVFEPPVVELHTEQPMVADVHIPLVRAARVTLDVPADPGVHAVVVDALGPEVVLRLRGLGPDQTTTARVRAVAKDGTTQQTSLDFPTPPALPGFVPEFEGKGRGSFSYVGFDMSVSPAISGGGLFVVDADRRTRFYLSTPSALTTPDVVAKVPAGLKLLPDGRLLLVQDHHVRILDELGNVSFDVGALDIGVDGFHHDVVMLPGGNVLVMGYEFRNIDYPAEAVTRYVAGDLLVELDPKGKKVWQWSSFEHLDPQRIRNGFFAAFPAYNPRTGQTANDWTHGNAIVYRAADDSILYSARHQDWLVKISHATGEVLWRLGDGGDFALAAGRWFFHQHSPEWEPDGTLLLYDNGLANPYLDDALERSRPVRFALDEKAHTATQVWDEETEKYLAQIAGDADRLKNGHVLVLDSSLPLPGGGPLDIYARVREVDPKDESWLFSLRTPDERFVFRSPEFPRLPGE